MGEPSTIALGIIGLGTILRQYLDTFATHPRVRIVAVADLDAARTAEVAAETGARACTVPELLADPEVELVLNLTIPAAHAEIALAALAAGKGVYGEKPLALTLADGRAMVEAATAAGLPLGAAPDTVLGTGVLTARRAVEDGLIGRPIAASATMVTPGHERWHPNPDFYYRPGGGPLLDMGPYYVSALVALLGPVVAVSGASSRMRDERVIGSGPRAGERIPVSIDTHITGILEHANGAISTLVTSFDGTATTASPIELHGTEGTLLVPDPNTFDGDVVHHRPGAGPVVLPPVPAGSGRGIGVLDLVDSADSIVNGTRALHVLDIMLGVLTAAESGTRVRLETAPAP